MPKIIAQTRSRARVLEINRRFSVISSPSSLELLISSGNARASEQEFCIPYWSNCFNVRPSLGGK